LRPWCSRRRRSSRAQVPAPPSFLARASVFSCLSWPGLSLSARVFFFCLEVHLLNRHLCALLPFVVCGCFFISDRRNGGVGARADRAIGPLQGLGVSDTVTLCSRMWGGGAFCLGGGSWIGRMPGGDCPRYDTVLAFAAASAAAAAATSLCLLCLLFVGVHSLALLSRLDVAATGWLPRNWLRNIRACCSAHRSPWRARRRCVGASSVRRSPPPAIPAAFLFVGICRCRCRCGYPHFLLSQTRQAASANTPLLSAFPLSWPSCSPPFLTLSPSRPVSFTRLQAGQVLGADGV